MNWKQILKTLPVVAVGNAVMAAGIVLFILPSGLITGGTTGLGILVEHVTGLSIPVFSAVFNIIMFLLGLFCLGKTFAATTLVSTFLSPLMLAVFLLAGFQLCGRDALCLLGCLAGYGLALLRGYRSLEGMNGDIAGYALTIGELCAGAVLALGGFV